MKLSEYLVLRGSRALTNAEARAIGVEMKKGWVRRYADADVPGHMVEMIKFSGFGKKKRVALKKAARRAIRIGKQKKKSVGSLAPAAKHAGPIDRAFVISDAFLSSYAWRAVRYEALVRHGGKCLACGLSARDGVVMNVDHIKSRRTHPELALDINNLQVLCHVCNHGKGNWDHTDWRDDRCDELDKKFDLIMQDG